MSLHRKVVPILEASGYEWAWRNPIDKADGNSKRKIFLIRNKSGYIDIFDLLFDKYSGARCQLHFYRSYSKNKNQIIIAGSLVARPTEYHREWGKPWLIPNYMWPDALLHFRAQWIAKKIPSIEKFITQGKDDFNIKLMDHWLPKDWVNPYNTK